jgi:hypothetical protein
MTTIHFAAIPLGLYQASTIWIDKPLHVMGGMLFAMIGLFLFQQKLEGANNFTKYFVIVQFALLGSFLWELFEFFYFTWFNEYALRFKFYSPTVRDALLDMLFGVIGGSIVAIQRSYSRGVSH